MAGIPGRRKRQNGAGGNVPLQTRVPAHVKERYERVANSRGISLSRLFEELINHVDPHPVAGTETSQEARAS
ncbi:hypothetical protein Ppa06_67400 [Planomonospora parontospora subsp. parontospora]|uniref:Uncharacterized protein n=2 Tax=Planomonospora parontospora TaxID=58119 RepID=A0AA37BPG5_9ACTN|nr:hypothetical protein [Planomonospora parontospora]GGK99463.1 hypothetical protein GCM10010126_68850 [Planomonospora parontospora]GII12942.1 hypothetical protein Ppa06_67400 [Planomonospora parontospora subsp. parontospora]